MIRSTPQVYPSLFVIHIHSVQKPEQKSEFGFTVMCQMYSWKNVAVHNATIPTIVKPTDDFSLVD